MQVTLIGRDVKTPYSGMIPGFVAGHYTFDECHIDLAGLCASTGARLVHGEATGIDRANRQVLLKDQPPLAYDVLSVDVGSAPNLDSLPGAAEWAIPVKPIAELGRRWLEFRRAHEELAGSARHRRDRRRRGRRRARPGDRPSPARGGQGRQLQVTLATKGEILAGQAEAARRRLRAIFRRRGVRLLENAAAQRIERGAVQLEDGWQHADAVFVVTEATAAPWFAATGLPLDERGFLAIDDTLRSTGDERIFAAGDCATMLDHRRPKAGVFAVRQGPPLARNLQRTLQGQAPQPFHPQNRYLAILGTGDGNAVATRGAWAIEDVGCGAGRISSIADG